MCSGAATQAGSEAAAVQAAVLGWAGNAVSSMGVRGGVGNAGYSNCGDFWGLRDVVVDFSDGNGAEKSWLDALIDG